MRLFSLSISVVLVAVSAGYVAASSQEPLTLPPANPPFNPLSYPKSVAQCSTINREKSELVDIELGEHL